ncbi:MAG: DUF3465 domain-containing protein [Nitrosomonas sp. PRO4]|nr:DUF3465 domain-containing protein [Nitrosomonas sp. PRO4]
MFIIELKSSQTWLIAHNIDLAPSVDELSLNDQIKFLVKMDRMKRRFDS